MVSDLGILCLPMSHEKDATGLYGLKWTQFLTK